MYSKCLTPGLKGFDGHLKDGIWIFQKRGEVLIKLIYFHNLDAAAKSFDAEADTASLNVGSSCSSSEALVEARTAPSEESFTMSEGGGLGEGRTEVEDMTGFSDEESAPPPSVASSSSASPRPVSKTTSALTVHQNPGWLEEMKKNIQEQIIFACSSRTREAVEQNEYIEVI